MVLTQAGQLCGKGCGGTGGGGASSRWRDAGRGGVGAGADPGADHGRGAWTQVYEVVLRGLAQHLEMDRREGVKERWKERDRGREKARVTGGRELVQLPQQQQKKTNLKPDASTVCMTRHQG